MTLGTRCLICEWMHRNAVLSVLSINVFCIPVLLAFQIKHCKHEVKIHRSFLKIHWWQYHNTATSYFNKWLFVVIHCTGCVDFSWFMVQKVFICRESWSGLELGEKRCRYGNNNHSSPCHEIITIPVHASGSLGMAYRFKPSHFEPWSW